MRPLGLHLGMQGKKLPYAYEVEYLESTGTQYVDTGIHPEENLAFDLKFRYVQQLSGYNNIMGARTYAGTTSRDQISFTRDASICYCGWGLKEKDFTTSYMPIGTDVVCQFSKNALVLNGNSITGINGEFISSNLSIFLFCRSQNGTASNKSASRIYYWKAYDGNSTLVRSLIPVVDHSGVACMYDKVSQQLFYNQGTGEFIAGAQV